MNAVSSGSSHGRAGGAPILPADIVLAPEWWHANEGITFDEDFFYHPARRVEVERRMERALHARWGALGLGAASTAPRAEVGAVHLAAGFLASEMLGCTVEYREGSPPLVATAGAPASEVPTVERAFASPAWRRFERLVEGLRRGGAPLSGDVNWSGILNVALDLRGQELFTDLYDRPEDVRSFFGGIAAVLEEFTRRVGSITGTTSISVNRTVRHLPDPVFLHSECSLTMLSLEDYERMLFAFDAAWSGRHRPFGIHFCGPDAHRFAPAFARLPRLDFLDVGWGSDIPALRRALPDTFLNLRLSPVEMIAADPDDIRSTIRRLVAESGDARRTGVCCINIDEKVPDRSITAMLETVQELRERNP
jgi:hypothetical protein